MGKVISVLLIFIGMVISFYSRAGELCSVENPVYDISLNSINVNPAASVGAIIAESGPIAKQIACGNAPIGTVWAYVPVSQMQQTGLSIQVHELNYGNSPESNCAVIATGYPGLGVAWYNYNSRTNWWQCVTNNVGINRVLNQGGSTDIIDEIYLVKTGAIVSGEFDFNMPFTFEEGWSDSTVLVSGSPSARGDLYQIVLRGQTDILAPVCNVSRISVPSPQQFSMDQAINQSFSSAAVNHKVTCDGYIENGTSVAVSMNALEGVFPFDSSYFSGSEVGMGFRMEYSLTATGGYNVVSPEDPTLDVPIYNGEADVFITLSPYVNPGSGVFPLAGNVYFNYELSVGEQ